MKAYNNFTDKFGNKYSFNNYMDFAKFWFNLKTNVAKFWFATDYKKLNNAALAGK